MEKNTLKRKSRILSSLVFFWQAFPLLSFLLLSACNSETNSNPILSSPDSKNFPPSSSFLGSLSNQERIQFLTGKYNPKEYLVSYMNPGDPKVHYLLPEVLEQYQKMKSAFQKEIQNIPGQRNQPLRILSSFRSFEQQKTIWNEKYSGKRKMKEPIQGKKPEEIVSLILQYSSAPGTSRHHWGTDLDLNSLEDEYFRKGNPGEFLYQWLTRNAHQFGFCQPYTDTQLRNYKGYLEEKWHWSYYPIASQLQKEWVKAYKKGEIQVSGFLGSEFVHPIALDYVDSINPNCTQF